MVSLKIKPYRTACPRPLNISTYVINQRRKLLYTEAGL
jgi:hypothetical protein